MIFITFKKIFVICMVLSVFLCLSTVCASEINNNTQIELAQNDNLEPVEISGDDAQALNAENEEVSDKNALSQSSNDLVETSYKFTGSKNTIKNTNVSFQILDSNGKKLSGKTVQVTFKGKTSNLTTDSKGTVNFKMYCKGTFDLNFYFNEAGYKPINFTKQITVIDTTKTVFKASNYVAYQNLKNPYTVKLKAVDIRLPYKKVTFKINGKSYTTKTNAEGFATLNIDLKKGTYTIKYSFAGETNLKSVSGSSKITVKKGMPVTIKKTNSVVYKHQTSAPFKVKITDARGDIVTGKHIVLKIGQKTYDAKTDKSGVATFNVILNKGVYTFKVYSYTTSKYAPASKSFTIKIKSNALINNGFWLFGSDMKKVNLNTMAKNGVNHIFLNSYAVTLHGESEVSEFAVNAGKLGINVHIWMQTFNDGSWISPVYSNGNYKYTLFNSIINEAKEYASIEGIDGIHFDYLRFPGTAYKYKNGVAAINYFTKQACTELHNLNSSLIVSAAIMPEPSSDKYYYGQDIPTISKYLDVIIPMIYKGNYGQGASWIKSVTSTFVSQSNGAQVWSGLQGYYSDSNPKSLPASTLINDADYAGFGGASGIIIFRYGLFNLINFSNL